MDTKQQIIALGDRLIREKGYNAFSFSDIGKELQIKNASIHYHFPNKIDLGLAVIDQHLEGLDKLMQQTENKEPVEKLHAFFSIYSAAKKQKQICLVGSLATDLYTFEEPIQKRLQVLTDRILQWVIAILEEGRIKKQFRFSIPARTKALMIITNMLASVQLTRLTKKQDFELIKETILQDLTNKK